MFKLIREKNLVKKIIAYEYCIKVCKMTVYRNKRTYEYVRIYTKLYIN